MITMMPQDSGPADIRVRFASAGDTRILAHHRVSMFRDMGEIIGQLERELTEASESFFRATLSSGEYLAWLAVRPLYESLGFVPTSEMRLARPT
jgi:hypothetical protein